MSRERWIDALLLVLAGLLLAQQLVATDLGLWITDQGRDGLWSEAIAAGGTWPGRGPAAAGLEVQGPAYFVWLGLLRSLGLANWRLGSLQGALTVAVVLGLLAVRRRLGGGRVVAVGVGLWQAHVALGPLQATATNPAWLPLLGGGALIVIALSADSGRRPGWIAAAVVAALWAVALQFHLSAALWGPAVAAMVWSVRRDLRWKAAAAVAFTATTVSVLLMGGLTPALHFAPGAAGAALTGAASGSPPVQLVGWLSLPWRAALWWYRDGDLGTLGCLGALLQWAAVLAGVGAVGWRILRRSGERSGVETVTLAWALSGLGIALFVPRLACYYLAGAVPALFLAAATSFAASRRWALVASACLLLANVTVFELHGSVRKSGQWPFPPGALWWPGGVQRLPVLRATKATIATLERAGVSYPCAVTHVHGRVWMATLMDGGYLASRWLSPETGRECRHLRAWLDVDGLVRLDELPVAPLAGWPPAPSVPRVPAAGARLGLRPCPSDLLVPADGTSRRINLLTYGEPPASCAAAPFTPIGLVQWQAELDGDTECRIPLAGATAWVDVEPLDGHDDASWQRR